MEEQVLKSALEALLFTTPAPVPLERLAGVFSDVEKHRIEEALHLLKEEYDSRKSGIMLAEVAGGYQLVTRPELAAWIRKFRTVKTSTRLSRPALETLAIIAYKQPITRTEVENIRGVNVGGIMRNLMERRLVKIVGKKDVPGKPMLYGTTTEFLQYFGLKDLSGLPTLKEFQELEASEDAVLTGAEPADDSAPQEEKRAEGTEEVGAAAAAEVAEAG